MTVLGATVLGETVLGGTVLGQTVLGATVLGATVLGVTVDLVALVLPCRLDTAGSTWHCRALSFWPTLFAWGCARVAITK